MVKKITSKKFKRKTIRKSLKIKKRTGGNLYLNQLKFNSFVKPVIYTFWTGYNRMSKQRQKCLNSIFMNTECHVLLITPDNLNNFILKDHPLHKSYPYLSLTHKADFLRTYFMNFHGGGYTDIKQTNCSWINCFDQLNRNTNIWGIGYPEVEGFVGYQPVSNNWRDIVGNCAYIFKPNTPFTNEWYNEMIKLLDRKYHLLKKNPAKYPQDKAENNTGYPIEWNEMLGRIFHKYNYKYKDYITNTLPKPIGKNYR